MFMLIVHVFIVGVDHPYPLIPACSSGLQREARCHDGLSGGLQRTTYCRDVLFGGVQRMARCCDGHLGVVKARHA